MDRRVSHAKSLTQLVQTSRATLSATQKGYRMGTRMSADVLQASESLYSNRRDLIRTRDTTIVTLLQHKAATVALDLDEVARLNRLLVGAARPAADGGVGRAAVR